MTDLLIDEPTGDLASGAPVSRPAVAAVPSLPAVDPSRLLDHRPAATRLPALGVPVGRAVIAWLLSGVEGGEVTLVENGVSRTFRATGPDRYGRPELQATVHVHDPRFHTAIVGGGSSGIGEAYLQGWFDVDDLTAFLRLTARAFRRFEAARVRLHDVVGPVTDRLRRLRPASKGRDRRNIAAHYDLGNDFFELFLDRTLTYSSGIFASPDTPLAAAQTEKIDRLCRRLGLAPGDRVVEIGSGWGAFAIHAASAYGAHVVTTTLSAEQYAHTTERVRAAGLADRIEVRHDDYRDLTGRYDALVAVEMIEAVDWRELDTFLGHVGRLLEPTGAAGLQAIVMAAPRYEVARSSRDFIKTHVFPGSHIPSVEAILRAAGRRTDLILTDLDDFGLHYAETLRRWASTLDGERTAALALGLDDPFLRLWEFYLRYCEAGFEERQVSVVQLVLERPGRAPSLDRGH